MSSLLKGHGFVHDRHELFVAVADFDQGEVHAGKIFDSIRGALKDLGSEDAGAGGKIVFFHGRMVPFGGKVHALQRYQMPPGAPNDFAPFFMGFQQVVGSTFPVQKGGDRPPGLGRRSGSLLPAPCRMGATSSTSISFPDLPKRIEADTSGA